MRTTRFIGVVGAVLCASALLGACGGDGSDDTFGCSGGGVTVSCIATAQYCEQVGDGTTTTGAACRAVPAGCGDDPCRGCLAMGSNGILTCNSIPFGTSRATTVTVRR